MNSSMSGWSTSRMTILAARRVLPPLLMTPAKASKPRMNLSGPEAWPPPERFSIEPRIDERIVYRVDEAGRALRVLVAGGRVTHTARCRVPVPVLAVRIRLQPIAAHVE